MLGLYQRKDQPVEVYLLAVLGFYFKPHRRIWSQDGVMETVRITVPKKIAAHFSDGLSKIEVKSSLDRLSTLMDTRGWAAKNAVFQTNVVVPTVQISDDRLIMPVQSVPAEPSDIHGADDMLDTTNNPTAQKFDEMVEHAAQIAHQHAVEQMKEDAAQQAVSAKPDEPVNAPNFNPYPAQIHQKILQPVTHQSYPQEDATTPNQPNSSSSTMTPTTPDAILELANRRDDNLSVETIAKEAHRVESLENDEAISLH